jgi:peptidoglycan/xylan/chitin deacetylase (PgdA/CDA1 family)
MNHPAKLFFRAIKAYRLPFRWSLTLISFVLSLSCFMYPHIIPPVQTKAAEPAFHQISLQNLAFGPKPFSSAPSNGIQTYESVSLSLAAFESIPDTVQSPSPAATLPQPVPVMLEPPVTPTLPATPVKPAKPVRIPVLNYHSITVDPGNPATITPQKFAAQMRYLSDNGYTALTLKQFADMMEYAAAGPAKPILLTFDDGYADNYEHALPLLKELGFHATLFMSPGMVEDGYFLNWDQIKEMHEAGWDIQPHGMSHPHLPKLSAEKQTYEISAAKAQIEEMLGTAADVFCYPYGERNQTTLRLLKDYEFRYAFTIEQGLTTPEQDPFGLRRVFVNGEETIQAWRSRFEK